MFEACEYVSCVSPPTALSQVTLQVLASARLPVIASTERLHFCLELLQVSENRKNVDELQSRLETIERKLAAAGVG